MRGPRAQTTHSAQHTDQMHLYTGRPLGHWCEYMRERALETRSADATPVVV